MALQETLGLALKVEPATLAVLWFTGYWRYYL
jgi:hypothetical protein